MRVSSGVHAASSPLTITAGGRQVSILLMICCVEDGDVDCALTGIVMRSADAANNFTAERGSIIRISRHFLITRQITGGSVACRKSRAAPRRMRAEPK